MNGWSHFSVNTSFLLLNFAQKLYPIHQGIPNPVQASQLGGVFTIVACPRVAETHKLPQ